MSRGARNISKEYANGKVVSVFFSIDNPTGGLPLCIRLPSNEDGVYQVLLKQRKRYVDYKVKEAVREQAKRTAWKLVQDWVEVQMSLVEMQQAEILQVFMPYLWNEQAAKSLYSIVKEAGFKALTYRPEPEPEEEHPQVAGRIVDAG